MKILLKVISGILAFYLGFSLALGLYEYLNGRAPWYTYENSSGERLIIGQKPANLPVVDENGKAISIVRGYAFPGSNTMVVRKKDSQGKYIFVQKQELPTYIRVIDTIFYPVLSIVRDPDIIQGTIHL